MIVHLRFPILTETSSWNVLLNVFLCHFSERKRKLGGAVGSGWQQDPLLSPGCPAVPPPWLLWELGHSWALVFGYGGKADVFLLLHWPWACSESCLCSAAVRLKPPRASVLCLGCGHGQGFALAGLGIVSLSTFLLGKHLQHLPAAPSLSAQELQCPIRAHLVTARTDMNKTLMNKQSTKNAFYEVKWQRLNRNCISSVLTWTSTHSTSVGLFNNVF